MIAMDMADDLGAVYVLYAVNVLPVCLFMSAHVL